MLTIIILAAIAAVGYFYIWPKFKDKQDSNNKPPHAQRNAAPSAPSRGAKPSMQRQQPSANGTHWDVIDDDGLHYEGYVDAEGFPHGKGKIKFRDGDTFEGEFNHKTPIRGIYTYEDGLRYEGPVNDGYAAQGVGTVYFLNGNVYEGECDEGRMHGMGKYKYFNKEHNDFIATYEGPMVDNQKVGQAKMTWVNGVTLEGIWEDDDCVKGTLRNPVGGYTYEGEFKNLEPHGKGVKTYDNGEVEDGVFDSGEFL